MDLQKITFPTFVLEPRSLLERITDFMAHPELMFKYACLPPPLCVPASLDEKADRRMMTPHTFFCSLLVGPDRSRILNRGSYK